jgi:hypothetical protein
LWTRTRDPEGKEKILLEGATGCGDLDLTAGITDDEAAPHVWGPAGLCSGVSMPTYDPATRRLLVVWSQEAKTGSYTFRITAA